VSDHSEYQLESGDLKKLEGLAWPIYGGGLVVGGASLLAALIVALFVDEGGRRFAYAYLIAVSFALALSLGSLFFVLITHLFRAAWCVPVRRIFETFAANVGIVLLMMLPIFGIVAAQDGVIYGWNHTKAELLAAAHHHEADHGEDHGNQDDDSETHNDQDGHAQAWDGGDSLASTDADHAVMLASADGDHHDESGEHHGEEDHGHDDHGHDDHAAHGDSEDVTHAQAPEGLPVAAGYYGSQKTSWLNRPFFIARLVVFFLIWTLIAHVFWKKSIKQDDDLDHEHSSWRENYAAPLTLVFAITMTLGVFDLLMSMDPAFYSTILGVYFFAGAFLSALCMGVLTLRWLQARGYLPSVNVEHYHDLGKLMFAFVFFWGYIAFSQYMLLWYANIPETAYWLEYHGMTADTQSPWFWNGWTAMALLLLFGHLFVPFVGLLSRRFKRNLPILTGWAVWLLIMCYVDLYWLVRPVLSYLGVEWTWSDAVLAVLCLVGVLAIFFAMAAKRAANRSLIPLNDPHLKEGLALRQI